MKIKDLVDLKGCYSAYDVGEKDIDLTKTELYEALVIAKEWLEKDVVERGFKKLILAKSPVVEALSTIKQAISKAQGEEKR